MRFPVHDWQFWVGTVAFAAASWYVARSLWRARPGRRRRGRSATLTVEGRRRRVLRRR